MEELMILEFLRQQLFQSGFLDINDFNQFGATRYVVYLSLHIQRTLVE